MNAVIIEDEIETAKDLQETIKKLKPDVNIIGLIDSIESGIEWFQHHQSPDIIFSDIQLGDGLAFDIFKTTALVCPIIFCTAYNHYAIEAFKNNGIDYLLKPVSEQELKKSFDKIDMLKETSYKTYNTNDFKNAVKQIVAGTQLYKTTFLISYREKIIPIHTSGILLFCICDKGVLLKTKSNDEYIINYTLEELESCINPGDFFRANRQYIIAFSSVKEIENYFERKLLIKLIQPIAEEIIISKAKAMVFLKWLEER